MTREQKIEQVENLILEHMFHLHVNTGTAANLLARHIVKLLEPKRKKKSK